WTRLGLPPGCNGPTGVTVDPADPARLYLAAWGRNLEQGATGGGVWISLDGGAHWRNGLAADQHIYDVTISPADPRVLYASGFEGNIWRSGDRGATWNRVSGFDFKWAHRVIPDPRDALKILVTTFGGGVWSGPAQ